MCTSLTEVLFKKVLHAYFFKTILNKASLIFAFAIFLADSLHSSKIDFIMFNVSHKSLQNIQ